jgi:non-specific serine/threonine protein kinase
MVALILSGLGELAVRQAQYNRATRLLEESLALRREQGHKWGIGAALGTLGWVAMCQRDFKRMKAMLGESLSVRMETGHQGGTAWCLEKLAEAAHLQGRSETAAKILGAAAALRAPIGSVIDPADQPVYERLIAELRSTMRDGAFDAYWAQGQSLPLDEVINEALAEPGEQIKPTTRADKEKYRGLTAREREVAVLIAQGKSNRDIAEALVIELKTVEAHVTRILNKLGFDNRVQIATWVVDKGLLPSPLETSKPGFSI